MPLTLTTFCFDLDCFVNLVFLSCFILCIIPLCTLVYKIQCNSSCWRSDCGRIWTCRLTHTHWCFCALSCSRTFFAYSCFIGITHTNVAFFMNIDWQQKKTCAFWAVHAYIDMQPSARSLGLVTCFSPCYCLKSDVGETRGVLMTEWIPKRPPLLSICCWSIGTSSGSQGGCEALDISAAPLSHHISASVFFFPLHSCFIDASVCSLHLQNECVKSIYGRDSSGLGGSTMPRFCIAAAAPCSGEEKWSQTNQSYQVP